MLAGMDGPDGGANDRRQAAAQNDASRTLEQLGLIGLEITASLDFADIFAAIERHLGALLDTDTLYIGLLEGSGPWIDVPIFVDGGKRSAPRRFHINDPQRPAARAIRENREILKEETLEEARANDIPGTTPTLTSLFRPLAVRGRVFGVISAQSQLPHAYGDRELQIFRSIAASAAVALANAESYRRLAAMENLQALGEIGQEITANLNMEETFDAIERHVADLFDVDRFAIGLADAAGETLDVAFEIVDGKRRSGLRIAVKDRSRPMARAMRERREIQVDFAAGEASVLSGVYRPLIIRNRVLGVMAMEHRRAERFGERQILILRTLAAYVAIAVANSDAYRQQQAARAAATAALSELRDAQASLIESEKFASLGQIVAGVAHEVNTPIGMAYTVATSLKLRAADFRRRLSAPNLRRSDLDSFLENVEEAARQLDINLQRASDLVRRFKEVAADQTSDQRRRFDLASLVDSLLASLSPEFRRSRHRIVTRIEPALELDSYPGALGQILINLVMNASVHAFAEEQAGEIRVEARRLPGEHVEILVGDDGVGMSEAHRLQVFAPFFTTRRDQGGTGLGLHIAFNLASQTLQGRLSCHSEPGRGSEFRLTIPRAVDAVDEAVHAGRS